MALEKKSAKKSLVSDQELQPACIITGTYSHPKPINGWIICSLAPERIHFPLCFLFKTFIPWSEAWNWWSCIFGHFLGVLSALLEFEYIL